MAQANIRAVITAEDRASRTLSGFGKGVDNLGNQIAKTAKVAALALAAAGTTAVTFGIKTAASLETARQGFVTLLGSAESADKIMARIKKEAARTPFEIAGLTRATQLLSSVTKNGDRALDFILDIGEGLAAMGRGQAELDRIAVNIQQIAATGRAFGIDIRQFAFAGIPIYEMLQEEIGKTGEELQAFIEEGGVTFELLEKMFKKSTEAGGRWAGAFENQAGTFNQLFANMKDSMAIFFSDLVQGIGAFDLVKSALRTLTEVFNGTNQTVNKMVISIKEVARQIFEYLGPKLENLWNKIQTDLIPALSNLWHNYLEPLVPIIGTILVVAVGFLIDALAFLIDHINELMPVLGALGAFIVGAKVVGAFNTLTTAISSAGGVTGAIATLNTKILAFVAANPFALLAAIGVAAFVMIKNAADEARAAMRDAQAAIENQGAARIENRSKLQSLYDTGTAEQRARAIRTSEKLGIRLNRQMGGVISRGQTAIVGERRPEIFEPREAGRIIPQPRLGGGQTTINLNVNVGMYAGTEVEKRRIAESLMRAYQDLQESRGMA